VDPTMIATKTGRVRSQRLGEEREGRARSARRSIRGPESGLGAAMRVRRWVGLALRKNWRRRGVWRRGRENILVVLVGCEAVVETDSRVGGSIYSKSRRALVTPNREGSGGGVE
jgi:hypothetical protein